jgi:hypothetical protein
LNNGNGYDYRSLTSVLTTFQLCGLRQHDR